MRVTKIRIRNFRGIRNLEVELGDITVLIGENNTGKTSVLDALGFCLQGLDVQHSSVFNGLDFHLAESRSEPYSADPIEIEVTISKISNAELERRLANEKILQLDSEGRGSFQLRVTYGYDKDSRDFKQKRSFIDLKGKPISYEIDSSVVLLLLQDEIRYYYLTALRDATHHFDVQGPFWKPFLKDSQLSLEEKTKIEALLREVNEIIISSHASFEQVRDGLLRIQSIISLSSGGAISIEAVPDRMFDILAKAQVWLGASTGAKIPLDRHGEGTQSLAVLMLFSVFMEVHAKGEAVLALEEPEAHLHPSAIRALLDLIRSLAGQKLISTHSGNFLAETDIHDIWRLARTESGIKVFHVPRGLLSSEEIRKFTYHVRRARGEMLYARCWLMVEGQSEEWVYSAAARVLGLSLHLEGVSIVEYSQSDVGMLTKIANALGIPWYCVGDNDLERSKTEAKLRENLSGIDEADRFIFSYENLEEHLKKNGYADVYERYSGKSKKARAAATVAQEMQDRGQAGVPQEIRSVIENTVSLARRGWQ